MAFNPKTWYLVSKKVADLWSSLEEETNLQEVSQLAKHYVKGSEDWYRAQIKDLPNFSKKIDEIANKHLIKINEESKAALDKAIELADNETLKSIKEITGINGDIASSKDEFLAGAIQRFSDFNKGEMKAFISSAISRNNKFVNNIRVNAQNMHNTNVRVKSGMWDHTQGLYDVIRKQTNEGIKYGVPVVYSDGRKVPFKAHMEMSVRTIIQNEASDRMENATKALGIIFFLASEHADCADDHANWQGKIYINDNWETVITDEKLKSMIKTFIQKNNIRTVQWVKDKPVYFTTRPNCRHYLIPITIVQAFGDINALKSKLKSKKGDYLEKNYSDLKKQRYNERAIRYYKERLNSNTVLYNKTSDPILKNEILRDIQKDDFLVRRWQARQRELILSNKELMREYDREDANKLAQDFGVSLHLKKKKDLQNDTENDIIDVDDEQHGLIDTATGQVKKTRIGRVDPRQLKAFTKDNGWYINWDKWASNKNVKVYAIQAENSKVVQGLMALEHKPDMGGTYVNWIVTAPHNNKQITGGTQKYKGVGSLMIAKAAQESVNAGFDGYLYGFANSNKTLEYYAKNWKGKWLGRLHPYHFEIDEKAAQELIRKYKVEENNGS